MELEDPVAGTEFRMAGNRQDLEAEPLKGSSGRLEVLNRVGKMIEGSHRDDFQANLGGANLTGVTMPILRSLLAVLIPSVLAGQSLPRVVIQTTVGGIEVEIDTVRAPVTTKNFLRYVDAKFYDRGSFHRTVTMANQPNNAVKIEVIQAGGDTTLQKQFGPIPLERTSATGLKHLAGTISMARASPLTSVKYAGSPWELGLSEAQQVLRANGLRGRVRVQTDGGLKTGLDVVKAAILGAESFGFGTAPMISLGCKYLRICHLNNCATGIATQDMRLRKEFFIGLPEMVINYFTFVARETREWMAALGVARFEDLIGRTDLLEILPGETDRQGRLRLDALLSQGHIANDAPRFCVEDRNPSFDKGELAEQMVADAKAGILSKTPQRLEYAIRNVNRSIGARLSGEIAKAHGAEGLPDDYLHLKLAGSAGQSLGVWNHHGLSIELIGDAND